MSLRLRSIQLTNFRKFRTPLSITGLTDGLNIIMEPNETGKSTILEALRAAFFVRYATGNQLTRSYAPHGESVAPRIEVEFDIGDANWSVSKQFLKNSAVDVRGPSMRAQGDEAEALLQDILGFEKDTSRGGNIAAYGTLGLLWVGQAEALSITAPGDLVRDTVLSTLEAEVGTIMGGATFDKVRSRIEKQFETYWTANSARPTGKQITAKDRLDAAKTASDTAQLRLATLENTFNDLEIARGRLKVIDREIADNTDTDDRAKLVKDAEIARAAAQVLATRTAEQNALTTRARSLEDLQDRHETAKKAVSDGEAALNTAQAERACLSQELGDATDKHNKAKEAVSNARDERRKALDVQKAGEALLASHRRRKAIEAACDRHASLSDLEDRHSEVKDLSLQSISAEKITELEQLDTAVTTAQVGVTIGATRIQLEGSSDGITINGDSFSAGERTITSETRIRLPSSAELIVRPPASASSAAATLEEAVEARRQALETLGVADLSAARARNEDARNALAEMRMIAAQIAALTPANDELSLEAGATALKLFIAELADVPEPALSSDVPDMKQLTQAVTNAESEFAKAEGVLQSALDALRAVEAKDTPLATAEAGAKRDLENARTQLQAVEQHSDFPDLQVGLAKAREASAEAVLNLENAKRDASVHNETEIERKIKVIDARVKATSESKRTLETEIARLEATVESEGGKGLADQAAAAREEAEAASAALERVTQDAETLKMLRSTLDEARLETSRSFLAPIARRAKKHIERILPGCDLSFSDTLSLENVIRAGVSESTLR